jgi:hypothetical protein
MRTFITSDYLIMTIYNFDDGLRHEAILHSSEFASKASVYLQECGCDLESMTWLVYGTDSAGLPAYAQQLATIEERKIERETYFVYFLQAKTGGPIKIGRSKNPHQRIKAHRTTAGIELVVLGIVDGMKDTEQEIHNKFAHLRQIGEMFSPEKELLDYIAANAKPYKPDE